MQEKLPIARLNRLTWLLSVIIGIIFYLIISRSGSLEPVYSYTLLTMAGILLVGYADVGLMLVITTRCALKSKKFNLYRRTLTYPASILIYLALWPIFAFVAHKKWSFGDIGLFFAFVGSGLVINTMIMILHDSVLLY